MSLVMALPLFGDFIFPLFQASSRSDEIMSPVYDINLPNTICFLMIDRQMQEDGEERPRTLFRLVWLHSSSNRTLFE